jgi:callose synthase
MLVIFFFCYDLDLEAGVGFYEVSDTHGFYLSPEAHAQADLKFTYVVTCQMYGKQKEEQKPEAVDIALLMQRSVEQCYFEICMP